MSKQTEALKLALEALDKYGFAPCDKEEDWQGFKRAITAIKEALAQPEYQSTSDKSKLEKVPAKGTLLAQPEQDWEAVAADQAMTIAMLKAEKPAQRKPLTDEQIGQILDDPNIAEAHQGHWHVLPFAYARAIEAAHGITGERHG